jgi:RHS repeat-associated protein
VLTWLLGDHLGSTSVTANADGTLASAQTYTAWGTTRSGTLPTDRQYTGQISESQLGIYFYNARYYDPYLARFISPDTLIPQPGSPLAWDRYSYTYNNPIRYSDPTGNRACSTMEECEDLGSTPFGTNFGNFYFSRLVEPDAMFPSEMIISEEGLDFIMSQEGFESRLYNDKCSFSSPNFLECKYNTSGDGVGNCTIGYGHLLHSGPCNGDSSESIYQDGISQSDAKNLLVYDVLSAEVVIQESVKVKITQSQYDALVSLVFNWGKDRFLASEKLVLLNKGMYVETALHFLQGPIDSGGVILQSLIDRRSAESQMFLQKVK